MPARAWGGTATMRSPKNTTAARIATCWLEIARRALPRCAGKPPPTPPILGAVAEDHAAHDGRLRRPQAVAQRGVRAAVDAADPTALLSDGVHARGLHDRAYPLRRQVAGVIEAVLADIGERDLPIHPNPRSE